MKIVAKWSKIIVTCLVLGLGIGLVTASAMAAVTPTLSLSATGPATVQLNVTGDPNATVALFYYPNGASVPSAFTNIGTTDGNGNFYTVINMNTYGIQSGEQVYVMVDGLQSASQTWPSYTNTNTTSSLSFSQTNISLMSGSQSDITVYNGANLYISNNSNPSVASVSINNNLLMITGGNSGTTVITVCSSNLGCGTVTVTVQNNNSGTTAPPPGHSEQPFRPKTVNMHVSQTTSVSIRRREHTSGYILSSNSNSSIASASINGGVVTIQGLSAGSDTLTLCTTANRSICSTITVNVDGSIALDRSQVSLNAVGQAQRVTIYGTGPFHIAYNGNGSVAVAGVNNNILTILALANGNTAITVCQNNGACSTVNVTVMIPIKITLSPRYIIKPLIPVSGNSDGRRGNGRRR